MLRSHLDGLLCSSKSDAQELDLQAKRRMLAHDQRCRLTTVIARRGQVM